MRLSSPSARCGIAIAAALFALAVQSNSATAQPKDKPLDRAGDAPGDGAPADGAPVDGAPVDGAPVDPPPADGAPADAAPVPENPEEVPVNLRLRRLEQRVQALKERAWRAKARVGMLKEAVLGGGVGARAGINHHNKMGSSFRLVKLVYALDGTQIFARTDNSGAMHKTKVYEILTGPIAPGSHTISVLALYRGHGYGVFKYLNKYKFTVRSSHTFTATEGKATAIKVVAFEKGGVTTPLEKRPAIDFKVTVTEGGK